MSQTVQRKWRPTLSMIVTAMIASALLLPLFGIVFFRLYEDRLIQSTEAELIAQSAVLSATMSELLSRSGTENLPLGTVIEQNQRKSDVRWKPTLPTLSLSVSEIYERRPDAREAPREVGPTYKAVGETLLPIFLSAQQQTLAGFRILDFEGKVIAGRYEFGQSLAHIEEVKSALSGRYTSALRTRIVDDPQPIYSVSRGTAIRIFTAMPVIVNERVAGVIYASRTPSNVIKELYMLRYKLALFAAAIIFIVGLMILIFARAILNPIHELTARAIKIGKGDRSAVEPLEHYGSREIFQLSNQLFDTSSKLFGRQDYINTFAAHVSHELKSPLTSIHGAAELLSDQSNEMSDAQRKKFLDNILKDTDRSVLLLDRLRQLAIAENPIARGSINMALLMEALQKRFDNLALELSGDDKMGVNIALENAIIVFSNLLENAANHKATEVKINAVCQDAKMIISVEDNGAGISKANAEKIFDIFFTTRRDDNGTGMGLAIVQAILKAHAGTIELVETQTENATTFQITLPTSDTAIQ